MTEHHCHAKKCAKLTSPRVLMCTGHWKMVPYALQKAVWAAYKSGQEVFKNPSREYLEAANAAIEAVALAEENGAFKPNNHQTRL